MTLKNLLLLFFIFCFTSSFSQMILNRDTNLTITENGIAFNSAFSGGINAGQFSEIDLNPLFKGFAATADRSTMNATFSLIDDKLKDTFDAMWKEAGINGLNGHRSVGGYRASMYNALPLESVATLVDVMSELERKA